MAESPIVQRVVNILRRRSGAGAASLSLPKLRGQAERGAAEAQYQLGFVYETGEGLPQNFVEATRWYTKAAEQGFAPAQSRLGDILLTGRGVPGSISAAAAERLDKEGSEAPSALHRLFPEGLMVRADATAALRWNQLAAEAGDAEAQVRLGYQFATSRGAAQDHGRAEHWFTVAAERGVETGQLGLGMLLAGGYGRPPDHARATQWFEKAAAQGNPAAKACLAALFVQGDGVPRDEQRAAQLYSEAAEKGHVEAMYHLGDLYREGRGIATDLSAAESWYRRAATRGCIPAIVALGRLMETLNPPDFHSAEIFYRQAAELGNAAGQVALARLCLYGRGTPPDAAEAARWLARAAESNDPDAAEMLGSLYAEGLGVAQDFAAARSWFDRAAARGNAAALCHLATMDVEGLGDGERDTQSVVAAYREAAERGSAVAALRLGVVYATGTFVAQDYAKAAEWYAVAASGGNRDGIYNLAFLKIRGLGLPAAPEEGVKLLESAAEIASVPAAWALYRLYSEGQYVSVDAARALRWLERAAEGGNCDAAIRLVQWLDKSDAPKPSATRVQDLLERLAHAGDPGAQAALGRLLFEGRHLTRDEAAGRRWLTSAAESGDAFAQAWLGDVLRQGVGVEADATAATAWYRKAGAQGHLGAIAMLTQASQGGGDMAHEAPSALLQLWLKAAEAGDATAQRVVADFYLRGHGTRQSADEAIRWLKAAAAQGDAPAKVMLGGILAQGQGTGPDAAAAVALFRQAAEQGNADAAYNLGVCFRRGLGVGKDEAAARQWYERAAAVGQKSAQLALGDLLAESGEKESDLAAAAELYRAAGAAGRGAALLKLGHLHEAGRGVPRDRDLALSLYRQALAAGCAEASAAIIGVQRAPEVATPVDLLGQNEKEDNTVVSTVSAVPAPGGPRGLRILRRSLFRDGRLDDAIAAARQIITDDPHRASDYTALGTLLFHKKDLVEAAAMLRRALELAPNDSRARSVSERVEARLVAIGATVPPSTVVHEPQEQALTEQLASLASEAKRELMMNFESLGDNCELGAAQRAFGAEPLSLFRWCYAEPAALYRALEVRFAGLGAPENVEIEPRQRGDFLAVDTVFGFKGHASVPPGCTDVAAIHEAECRKLQFLRSKLIEELETGEKIFVFKRVGPIPLAVVERLCERVHSYGPNTLLWVVISKDRPCGTIEVLREGFFKGHISDMADQSDVLATTPAGEWLKVCANAYRVWQESRSRDCIEIASSGTRKLPEGGRGPSLAPHPETEVEMK